MIARRSNINAALGTAVDFLIPVTYSNLLLAGEFLLSRHR